MDTSATTLVAPAQLDQQPLAQIIERVSRGKRRRRLIAALLALLATASAVALWRLARPQPAPLAARFRSAAVSQGDVVREVNATGHIEAMTSARHSRAVRGARYRHADLVRCIGDGWRHVRCLSGAQSGKNEPPGGLAL